MSANLTNSTFCLYSIDEVTSSNKAVSVIAFTCALISVLSNTLAIFILTSLPTRKSKFIQYMRDYSANCLVASLNIACLLYILIFFNSSFKFNFVKPFYYVIFPIYLISYSFSTILSSFIVYERIQMFKLQITFLRNTPAWKSSAVTLFLSILLSLPFFYNYEIKQDLYQIEHNNQTKSPSYSIDVSAATKSHFFRIVFLLFLLVRHGGIFLIELIMNIYLLMCLKTFYRNRSNNQRNAVHISELTNNIIILITCILSMIQHVITLLVIYFSLTIESCNISNYRIIALLIFALKHALNFFILVLLNSHFRECFMSLLPTCKCPRPSVAPASIELINLETIATKL